MYYDRSSETDIFVLKTTYFVPVSRSSGLYHVYCGQMGRLGFDSNFSRNDEMKTLYGVSWLAYEYYAV